MKQKSYRGFWSVLIAFSFLLCSTALFAQGGINEIGSFEQENPSYWNKAANPGENSLSWATDEFVTLGRSLKITKTGTGEAAIWESDNMCDIWSPIHNKDVDLKLGAWVKTMGVNTNPATEDAMWYISYTFYNEAGGMIGEVKLPIDQSVATSDGWVADTNDVGSTILPEDSYTTIIKFVAGPEATGMVWADEFMLQGRTGWAGGMWNETIGVSDGWIYWVPRVDGAIGHGYANTRITDEEAYHGKYSLKFDMLEGTHDGFVGTRFYPMNLAGPGEMIRIAVWIKGENLQPDSAAAIGDQANISITPIFHNSMGGNDGFNDIWASDIVLKFPPVTEFDWTQYYVDVRVPEADAKSLDIRLHPLGRFEGTVYFDALTVEKLNLPELNEIGSFEQENPSYWNKAANPGENSLSWATDEFVTLGRSLKITKTGTGEAAMWESDNMCDIWSPIHNKDVDLKLGAWVKTMDVNTNPANEDEMWYVSYTFYNEAGGMIGEVKLPIDQTVATSDGWVADTNDVGSTILPEDSYTTIIKFGAGPNATGTVWADEFVLGGRTGWAGGIWNETIGVPEGWIYWVPRVDGAIGHGYANTRITDEAAYHGKYSLKFDMLEGTHDGFVGTRFFPIGGDGPPPPAGSYGAVDINDLSHVRPGDMIRIAVWIKGENLQPDSAAVIGDQANISITPIFHNSLGGNEGFNDIWASDIVLKFPPVTEFDWTQYYVDVRVPEADARSLDVRLHPLGRFEGTVYFDALTIERLEMPEISGVGSFEQENPSYWNKAANPGENSLSWATDEFVTLGRSLKITKTGTGEAAMWESDNMCDIWSPIHNKDVDLKLGAWVKTMDVNTNPANEDEMWYVSYTFYNEAGGMIGEVKLPIDQTVATSDGWVADTNDVGSTILPEDSYTTIIKFGAGPNATGTVWADEFVLGGRTGWAGGIWNETIGVPEGWIYWVPRVDGAIGHGYANTRITDEAAYHGKYSLKFDMLEGTHDGFVGTRFFPLNSGGPPPPAGSYGARDISELNAIGPGDMIRIAVWIKGENLQPDSAAVIGDQANISITPIFHNSMGGNDGFNDVWASDIVLKFPQVTEFDWTQYYVDVQVPEADAKTLDVRLHPLGRFEGTVYFDALTITKVNVTNAESEEMLPVDYTLFQNYPNPFNPATTISYAIPEQSFVSVKIYDMLGRKVKTLISETQNAGLHTLNWNGDNEFGTKVSSGTYIYRIESGEFFQSRKMVLLK